MGVFPCAKCGELWLSYDAGESHVCNAMKVRDLELQIDRLQSEKKAQFERLESLRVEFATANRLFDEVREALRELVHDVEDCWNHGGRCLIGTDLQTPETKCECGAWDLIEEPLALLARVRPTTERPKGPCICADFRPGEDPCSTCGGYAEKRNDEKPPMPVCDKCGGGYGVTHPLFNKDSQYKRLCHKCDR